MREAASSRRTITLVVALLLVVPLALLLPRAFADAWRAPDLLPQAWGLRALREATRPGTQALEALLNTVVVAVAATSIGMLVAWPAARTLARLDGLRRTVVFVALLSPLLLPPYATGVGLTAWLLRLGLADHLVGIVAAHLVHVVPYVLLALLPAMGRRLDGLEEAARTCGAGRWEAWWRVVLPAARNVVGTALLLGFLVSWAQVGTSLAVGGGVPMLPVIALPFTRNDPQVASLLNLALLLPPLAVLWLSSRQRA